MTALIFSILYTLFYAFLGTVISCSIFRDMKASKKVWFGLAFGLFGMTWMPSLFSFITGRFNAASHLLGILLFFLTAVFCFIKRRPQTGIARSALKESRKLLALLPLLLIGLKLFGTHILQEKADGLYVGQTTYGDLAMHLGFISSLGTQGAFPPDYSIFPGHAVNYPFLCEVSASSLYLFGADLRASCLISALYAYVLVLLGVYFLFETWLKRPRRAILATYLFFLGGGFGFAYFLNNAGSSSFVASLLNSSYPTNLSQLLEGYYTTPTNLPELGLRWVNPIVDMLVPQRATLFGWAFLFPCLTLLHEYMFHEKKNTLIPLALLAAGLPLIHTHSFLALGIISGVYCLYDLISNFRKQRLFGWLAYAGIVLLLAFPQLFGFAFRQVSESSMVKLHFNWANEKDSWFWFYLKNWGILFLFLVPGMTLLSKRDRLIMSGPLTVWAISEVVIFQPNTYDNNKLIFVFFAYLCGLSAKLISVISRKLRVRCREREVFEKAFPKLLFILSLLILFFTLMPALSDRSSAFMGYMKQGQLFTLLFLGFLFTVLSFGYAGLYFKKHENALPFSLCLLGAGFCAAVTVVLLRDADSLTVWLPVKTAVLILVFEFVLLAASLLLMFRDKSASPAISQAPAYAFYRVSGCVFLCVVFLSGVMTVAREWVSSYQVFGTDDLRAAEFVKEETPADSVFLTSYSWHLNTVSVLTGRNIVCGPDLYLYYHGIDTSERKADVDKMFAEPEASEELFEKYGVAYVYIGPDERYSYTIDREYFEENCEKVYDSGGIAIYRL